MGIIAAYRKQANILVFIHFSSFFFNFLRPLMREGAAEPIVTCNTAFDANW